MGGARAGTSIATAPAAAHWVVAEPENHDLVAANLAAEIGDGAPRDTLEMADGAVAVGDSRQHGLKLRSGMGGRPLFVAADDVEPSAVRQQDGTDHTGDPRGQHHDGQRRTEKAAPHGVASL